MKLKNYAYLYSKLGNYTLKIMKKYLEIYLKNLEKSWKYHGILSVRKSGNPVIPSGSKSDHFFDVRAFFFDRFRFRLRFLST